MLRGHINTSLAFKSWTVLTCFVIIVSFLCHEKVPKLEGGTPGSNKLDQVPGDVVNDSIPRFDFIGVDESKRTIELKKVDRKKYARIVLKQFAFCNCLYQSLEKDSLYRRLDASNGFMAIELKMHSYQVLDTVSAIVSKYVQWMNSFEGPVEAKNYTILCLGFYESHFLDSLVARFDDKIFVQETLPETPSLPVN